MAYSKRQDLQDFKDLKDLKDLNGAKRQRGLHLLALASKLLEDTTLAHTAQTNKVSMQRERHKYNTANNTPHM